jgi:hypothetical protein
MLHPLGAHDRSLAAGVGDVDRESDVLFGGDAA